MDIVEAPLGSELLAACLALRRAVFVDEQGVPPALELDADDRDPKTRHLALLTGDSGEQRVVATVRWIVEPLGYSGIDAGAGRVAHLQRLAVAQEARGRGLGAALVAAVESDALRHDLQVVYLASQAHAVPFYRRLGYRVHGDEFSEAGIPHLHMSRRLI